MDPQLPDILPSDREVFASAEKFDGAQTGIVVAATAGFVALTYLVSILFLVLASMGTAILLYRILLYFRPKDALEKSLQEYDELLARQTRLSKLDLPADQKQIFTDYIRHRMTLKARREERLIDQKPNKKKLKP